MEIDPPPFEIAYEDRHRLLLKQPCGLQMVLLRPIAGAKAIFGIVATHHCRRPKTLVISHITSETKAIPSPMRTPKNIKGYAPIFSSQ